MKNIHLIPTDKPSNGYILGKCIKELADVKKGQFAKTYYLMLSEEYFQPHHIYITSDSEINEGDWFLNTLNNKLDKCDDLIYKKNVNLSNWCKKIILTTDGDLIKDGIQAIDDEFLEWFVKNPSCEEVEVSEDYFKPSNMVYGHDTEPYKIIIPKEEQKQHLIDMMKSDEKLGLYDDSKQICECTDECLGYLTKECKHIEEPKQETTIEEAAANLADPNICKTDNWIAGAKWQAQRIERLRNELYEQLPTGEVNAFDLIKTINNHINKLDELIKK